MHIRFIRQVFPFVLMSLHLLLLGNGPVHAQPDESKRETFKLQSPDKLKIILEKPQRINKQQPDRVIDAFGVKKGDSIADIGAGTGFHSFRLAAKVGAEGKVYAVEIQDDLLKFMGDNVKSKNLKNIELVKSSESDPNLPPESCDKVLVANTYYYLHDPIKFMSNLRKALKPEGRVAIIDLDSAKAKKKRENMLSTHEMINEMKQAGFNFIESFDFLDRRFFLVFNAAE